MVLFISYSHDSDEHREWVLRFSERLREDGYETQLDLYVNGSPAEGWPRWMLDNLDEASFVLMVCTETYYRRFRGHEKPGKGKGVDWEGAIITQEIYDKSSQPLKFVPLLVRASDEDFIPEPVRGLTRYVIDTEESFASLYDFLEGVAGVDARPVRNREPRTRRTAEPLRFSAPSVVLGRNLGPPCQMPTGALIEFVGRKSQLDKLTRRLRDGLDTGVVGPGGYGKTALAAEAIRAVVGEKGERLANSPFPDGIVMLDLYLLNVQAGFDSAWHDLAGLLRGKDFLSNSPAEERARRACEGRRILVIVEGAELAGRQSDLQRLLSVLDGAGQVKGQHCRLVLTRDSSQAEPLQTVKLDDRLPPDEAAQLFDSLLNAASEGASTGLDDQTRAMLLKLLDGHPLAITWATGLIARGDEDLTQLIRDWHADPLLNLTDPNKFEHSLRWLFDRSVRGLNELERNALIAAGMLAHAPFPVVAIEKALGKTSNQMADQNDVRSAMKRLVQCQLLRRVEGVTDQREFPHVFAYQFARALATSSPNTDLTQGLGDWAVENLRNVLEARGAMLPISALRVPLEHAVSLMKSASAADSLFPLVTFLLYSASDRLTNLGCLDLVAIALQAVRASLQRPSGEQSASSHWQQEFAACLSRLGDLARAEGNLPEAQRLFGDSLRIAQCLAESNPADAVCQNNLSASFQRLGDLASAQGNLPETQRLYDESLSISQRLAASDLSNVKWQRDLSVSFNKLGGLAIEQGNLPEAQRLYSESLHIRRRLTESDASNVKWQRDLSVSTQRLGDLAMAQGNLPEAQRLYRESLNICRRLTKSDAANATWQRDLAVSLERHGDLALAMGNLLEAQRVFGESLHIWQRLTESDRANATWQHDLSVSTERLGDLAMAQGNLPEAQRLYRESLYICRRLTESDPANATWQSDLAVSINRLGDLATALGNLTEAKRHFGESLHIRERLAESDPANATWQRDLSVSISRLGELATAQGDLPEAQRLYGDSLHIVQRLAESDPANAMWQRDLSVCLTKIGEVYMQTKEWGEALPVLENSLVIDERLAGSDPTNETWKNDVEISRWLVEEVRRKLKGD